SEHNVDAVRTEFGDLMLQYDQAEHLVRQAEVGRELPSLAEVFGVESPPVPQPLPAAAGAGGGPPPPTPAPATAQPERDVGVVAVSSPEPDEAVGVSPESAVVTAIPEILTGPIPASVQAVVVSPDDVVVPFGNGAFGFRTRVGGRSVPLVFKLDGQGG